MLCRWRDVRRGLGALKNRPYTLRQRVGAAAQASEPAVVGALHDAYPNRSVAKNRHPIPSWSPVGNVDVLIASC